MGIKDKWAKLNLRERVLLILAVGLIAPLVMLGTHYLTDHRDRGGSTGQINYSDYLGEDDDYPSQSYGNSGYSPQWQAPEPEPEPDSSYSVLWKYRAEDELQKAEQYLKWSEFSARDGDSEKAACYIRQYREAMDRYNQYIEYSK